MARHIAGRVARELGQPIVIDNSPSAGGTVGAAKVSKVKNEVFRFSNTPLVLMVCNNHPARAKTQATFGWYLFNGLD